MVMRFDAAREPVDRPRPRPSHPGTGAPRPAPSPSPSPGVTVPPPPPQNSSVFNAGEIIIPVIPGPARITRLQGLAVQPSWRISVSPLNGNALPCNLARGFSESTFGPRYIIKPTDIPFEITVSNLAEVWISANNDTDGVQILIRKGAA